MQKKVTVIESFNIIGRGISLELQHQENGLLKNTILFSEQTSKKWKIKSRIIHFDSQKKFEIENIEIEFLSFTNLDKRESSEKNILDRESENIFWYKVISVNHEEKPIQGEILLIVSE